MSDATKQRVFDLVVQPGITAAASLATDEHLLRAIPGWDISKRAGVLRVYATPEDTLSIGRYHLVPEDWAARGGRNACRRLTGGRILPSGAGFIGLSIVLPHRSALVSNDPLALAPQQVLNRCVRGILAAFKDIGVPAFYPGLDLVTVDHRALAALSFEVSPPGSLLFEAIIANTADFAGGNDLLSRIDSTDTLRARKWGIGEVTSIKEQLGFEISVKELAELLRRGYERQFDVQIELPTAPLVVPDDGTFSPERWLLARRHRSELDRHASASALLGTVESFFSVRPSGEIDDIALTGDFIAASAAIDELEATLRGSPLDRDAINAIVDQVFSKPENFILGIGSLSSIADMILSAPRRVPAPDNKVVVKMPPSSEKNDDLSELRSPVSRERVEALARTAARAQPSADEIEAILECLASDRKIVQRRAAETLAGLERAGVPLRDNLVGLLRSDRPRSRWGATYALSLIGSLPVQARETLFESLGSADGDIRWAAVDILLRLPDWYTAADELCDLLAQGGPAQRKMAAYTLRGLKQRRPRVQAALSAALLDAEPSVRMAAVAALLHLAIDRTAATESACRLLSDPDAGVRRATAALLGELGVAGKVAIEALRLASVSEDDSLRRAATRSLRKLQENAD
jgi:HEAT repeat protein